MKVGVIQLKSTANKVNNIKKALYFVERSIKNKTAFILLPEVFHHRGAIDRRTPMRDVAENWPGPSTIPFMELAKKHKVHILLGSIYEKILGKQKSHNTSLLINQKGEIESVYRKIHLFDAVVGKNIFNESRQFLPGRKRTLAKVGAFKIGMSVCFDLRFPDLYQFYARRGAHVLTVPSAFAKKTGEAHWESLIRARAIENSCYVLAPNQVGEDSRGAACYGHSMIVDPWGKVMAEASSNKEEIIYGTMQLDAVLKSRQHFKK